MRLGHKLVKFAILLLLNSSLGLPYNLDSFTLFNFLVASKLINLEVKIILLEDLKRRAGKY